MDEESKKLGAVTARRHPEYDGNKDHWTFLNETYTVSYTHLTLPTIYSV